VINHIFATEPEVQFVWTEPSEQNLIARRRWVNALPTPAGFGTGESYWELSRDEY
jgi:hypothetical protein